MPSCASLKTSSSETLRPERRASASVFRRLARSPASWRARRSFSTTRTSSPASGTPSKPSTSTGWPGIARFILLPMKSCIARTRPKCAPATSASPTRSVPRWIRTVTTGPRPGSSLDSITVPDASAPAFAFSSSRSVTTWIVSSSVSRPSCVFALTSTNSISPPHSDGCRPCWVISVRTRSGCAPSLSILLTATMIGTSAAFAWSIASSVCGLTPSSAATTITARSVTRAPRARIAVNASWPGVSRKVISLPAWRTW